jgi:hypothetical protein
MVQLHSQFWVIILIQAALHTQSSPEVPTGGNGRWVKQCFLFIYISLWFKMICFCCCSSCEYCLIIFRLLCTQLVSQSSPEVPTGGNGWWVKRCFCSFTSGPEAESVGDFPHVFLLLVMFYSLNVRTTGRIKHVRLHGGRVSHFLWCLWLS